jgi:hypothetical protein
MGIVAKEEKMFCHRDDRVRGRWRFARGEVCAETRRVKFAEKGRGE